ncbi:MAG: hypothetical protein JWO87_101, partial [Phycisphaerales bacterium]|nr:hypothetical protein [Phycisphaerales bacterium]
MKSRITIGRLFFLAIAGLTAGMGRALAAAEEAGHPLKQGDAVTLGVREGVVTTLDTLPYVESEYTKRFKFDSYDNPKLKQLRDRYHLDEVVAPCKTEFDRQVLLLDWVNHRFKKFGKPSSPARGHYADFGDLAFDAVATDLYAFIGYVPNTDLLDRSSDWGNMFITQDKLCDGTPWHKRTVPA